MLGFGLAGTVRALPTHSKGTGVSSNDDGGYVHDPAAFDDDGDRPEPEGDDSTGRRSRSDPADREFDWRGWVAVGMIVVTFVVAPVAILLWPRGVAYHTALVALPLLPAFLLALIGVWATARA